jgi:hypothetical protein
MPSKRTPRGASPGLFDSPLPAAHTAPGEAGLACRGCGAAEVKTRWQEFKDGSRHIRAECARCGGFLRYLTQPLQVPVEEVLAVLTPADDMANRIPMAPPPEGWQWVGHVRLADGVWRPVALASSLTACWDSLLRFPGRADLLCIPCWPVPRVEGPADEGR